MKSLTDLAKHWHPKERSEVDAKTQLLTRLGKVDAELKASEATMDQLRQRVNELEAERDELQEAKKDSGPPWTNDD